MSTTATAAPSAPGTGAEGVRWNLADLYAGADDPALREDQQRALERARAFEQRYRGQVAALDAEALYAAVAELEQVAALAARPMIFAHLLFAADTGQPRHGALLQAAREQLTRVQEHLIFFELEWLEVPEPQAALLLAEPALAPYRHYLSHKRRYKPYTLSEAEERVLQVKANTGSAAFQRLFDEVVGQLTCRVDLPQGPQEKSLQETLSLLYGPQREVRRAAADAVTNTLHAQGRVLTFVFNTLVQDHAENDRLRGRAHPMLERNLGNEIEQGAVDALLNACDDRMGLVHRYYRLKRALLGYDALYDHDRYAPVADDLPLRQYDRARETVLQAYGDFSAEMAEIARRFFDEGWIDAELRPGKQGGAFSASTLPELHPYILLNYNGTLRDVMTLAHELGHGIHQYLSREQGFFQQQTPLTTAETASVFGEMLAFRRLMAEQPEPRVRLALLCSKLEDIFATVFRQAVMTRFEQRLHAARRELGELSAEAIGELWQETNRAMFGDTLQLTPGYAAWWRYIPHFIHAPFYCYAYSFGELLVLALYRRYEQEGAAFIPRYLRLLRAGGSASPAALVGGMGMDIEDAAFWQQGLSLLDGMVGEAERLAAGLGLAAPEA